MREIEGIKKEPGDIKRELGNIELLAMFLS